MHGVIEVRKIASSSVNHRAQEQRRAEEKRCMEEWVCCWDMLCLIFIAKCGNYAYVHIYIYIYKYYISLILDFSGALLLYVAGLCGSEHECPFITSFFCSFVLHFFLVVLRHFCICKCAQLATKESHLGGSQLLQHCLCSLVSRG